MTSWGPYYWPMTMTPPPLFPMGHPHNILTPIIPPPPPPPVNTPPPPPAPLNIPPAPQQPVQNPFGPSRYTIEEITPLIRTIIQQIYETETTTTLEFDDDDSDMATGVDLEDLRLHTTVNIIQDAAANGGMCAICQDEYANNDITRSLRCKHAFHMKCIDQVLEKGDTCPMCRMSVVPEEEDDDEDGDADDVDD